MGFDFFQLADMLLFGMILLMCVKMYLDFWFLIDNWDEELPHDLMGLSAAFMARGGMILVFVLVRYSIMIS